MSGALFAIVRRLGSGATHAVDVGTALPPAFVAKRFGSECIYLDTPVVAGCGVVLRAGGGVAGVVVMHPETVVTCAVCRRMVDQAGRAEVLLNLHGLAGPAHDSTVEPVDDDLLPRTGDVDDG